LLSGTYKMHKKIAHKIKEHGGKAYLVGGVVRDTLLGKECKDIDMEIYNLPIAELESILLEFGDVKFCGKSYGVFKLGNMDIAIPRTERKAGEGHKAFDIQVDPFMPFEEACKRRDLTINAMLMCPLTNEIIDPFGGQQDLNKGIIRHVNDATFAEDPLRVLRVAQFMARFGFVVDDTTTELCKTLLDELKTLPKERVMQEIEKILLKAEYPSTAFRYMEEHGILEVILPEVVTMRGVEQGTDHHPEGDVFEHTMFVLDTIPIAERKLHIMLTLLAHDLGKAVVGGLRDGESVHFKGHGHAGADIARVMMGRLTTEVELTEQVVNLVKHHMRPYDLKRSPHKTTIRRLALKVDMEDLLTVHTADKKGRGKDHTVDLEYVDRIRNLYHDIKHEITPFIKGRNLINLGLTPSRTFGKILRDIFEAQLDGEFASTEEGIEYTKQYLVRMGLL